jgi:hypothetical protein
VARVPPGAPFGERGNRLGGVIDLVAGRYPGFVFGLPVGRLLPVFHFHQSTVASVEPALQYLAENGYRTVQADDVARLVRDGRHPGPRSVMLCFDDALASLWLVVAPLLSRYGLRAVTYAIPGRIAEAASVRPTIDDGPVDGALADAAANPFATWPELKALSDGGIVDVQSHTHTHSMMFAGQTPLGVVTPDFAAESHLNRPATGATSGPAFLTPGRLGHPLYPCRSRMSDGRRFYPDPDACSRLESFVQARGGPAFFSDPGWSKALAPELTRVGGHFEDPADRAHAIEDELVAARDMLNQRLGRAIGHVCMPWGVSGRVTRAALERLGFVTAMADRPAGRLAVAAGDDPYFLKRLNGKYVFALPGRGRRIVVTLA